MTHKELVQEIAALPWETATPDDIILLSLCTAREFSESLRLAKKVYPNDERLDEMMAGELKTDNMAFEDYTALGDHWEFLAHFVDKYHLVPSSPLIEEAMGRYLTYVRSLSDADRAMTIFSREEELTLIFEKIVAAHDWDAFGRTFYKYYLAQHILFDSGDNGHAWLTKHFPVHEPTLEAFYKERLALYRVLFATPSATPQVLPQ